MRIIIAAGGTGGHLFPAIRVAQEINLKKTGQLLFVTTCNKEDKHILKEMGIRFKSVPLVGFRSGNILHILNFTLRLIIGTIISIFLLLLLRPSVIIGFGGYISGPILLLGSLFRVKTIIHEQNVYPGKTNRMLARFVDRIAVSFAESVEYLKGFESKLIVSGNPLRQGLKKKEKGQGTSFTILAMGGSQGAHTLNKFIPEAVGLMQDERKNLLDMIHISGYKEKNDVIKAYQDKGIRNRVFPFTLEIDKLYNECDFVIARSGATTISELLYLAKPSILIPYPYAAGNHQRLNAKVLQDKGIAVLLEEGMLSPRTLRDAIERLMDREVLRDMSRRVKNDNYKDACNILIKEING